MSLKDPVASGCDSELFICKVKLWETALSSTSPARYRCGDRLDAPDFPSPGGICFVLPFCSAALPRYRGGQVMKDAASALESLLRLCGETLP